MHVLRQPFRRNAEFDSGTPGLRPEDAPIARHQASNEFSKGRLVPAPRRIRETFELRLLAPKTEFPQPADNRIGLPRMGASGGLVITADVVMRASLRHVAGWEMQCNSCLEIRNQLRIDINEFRGGPRQRTVTGEIAE